MGQRGEAEEARRAGIGAYLTKPVRQSELYDCLATVMGEPEEEASPPKARLITRHALREKRAAGRARVLVAEDNPANQKVAAKLLESLGYRVDVACDGLEVLEALSQARYEAVLMDVQMPGMDGCEATAEVRKREQGKDRRLPIIAMTADALQDDREKALQAGMDDYLPKPVNAEELGTVLRRWISERGASFSPPGEVEPGEDAGGVENYLDPDALAGLRELGGSEMLSELAQMFFDDTNSSVAALREALERGDAPGVERIAHTLKGSSGNMGARRMSVFCAELQEIGASGDLARAPKLLERLEEEFGRIRPALEAEATRGRD
jgi:CheY-like chemotaxis protein